MQVGWADLNKSTVVDFLPKLLVNGTNSLNLNFGEKQLS